MVEEIREFIDNGLEYKGYVTEPKYVSKLPKCLHCITENLKSPLRPLKPPFPRTLDSLDLPARPSVYHLPPLTRPFRSTPKGPKKAKIFRSSPNGPTKPKSLQKIVTKPLKEPYKLKLEVEKNLGGTRKLRDFGVYKAAKRNFREVNASEDLLIKAVSDFDFAKV